MRIASPAGVFTRRQRRAPPAPAASSPGVSPAWSRDTPSLARRTAGMVDAPRVHRDRSSGVAQFTIPGRPPRAHRQPGDTPRAPENSASFTGGAERDTPPGIMVAWPNALHPRGSREAAESHEPTGPAA